MNIFEKEPDTWGLRGDAYLWEELKKKFKDFDYSKSNEEFAELLDYEFTQSISHAKTTESKNILIMDNYPRIGMSGGHISIDWWQETGLPFLKTTYSELHKEIESK